MNDKYISVSKFKQSLAKLTVEGGDKEYVEAIARTLSEVVPYLLDDSPAADVQPVKRGNWVQIGKQSAKCTECGGVLKSNGIDKTGKALIFNAVYHYCPFCGARMDGDSECQ